MPTRLSQKRFIVNKLEGEAVVRADDADRWLDVSWGVREGVDAVPLVKKILSLLLDRSPKPV